MTTAISDLGELLRHLDPVLGESDHVFCSVAPSAEAQVLASRPLSTFWESEGLSVIIDRASADGLKLPYDSIHRCIKLRVHSSLTAVGLTGAVAQSLADAGISANVVAAHDHDYVFVPAERSQEALAVLQALSNPGG